MLSRTKKHPPPSLTWHVDNHVLLFISHLPVGKPRSSRPVLSYSASDVTSTPAGEWIGSQSQTADRTD